MNVERLGTNDLYHGDALSVLRTLPAESVHMVVTSPPYLGLRDYGLPPLECPALPERCIRAGTSAHGVCPTCGAPWTRVVERERKPTRPGVDTKVTGRQGGCDGESGEHSSDRRAQFRVNSEVCGNRDPQRHCTTTTTTGWQQGCRCPAAPPVPATVLEPFLGSGTTLEVAALLGRRGVGIEPSGEYLRLARKRLTDRLGMFAMAMEEVGAQPPHPPE